MIILVSKIYPELTVSWGLPGGSEVKASAWNVGDRGSIPESGRSPGRESQTGSTPKSPHQDTL